MTKDVNDKPLLILDFGSQYTELIARRIREMGVYCEIFPCDLPVSRFAKLNPCGIILSGGPSSVTVVNNPHAPQWVFEGNLPVLGICYGMQTMALQLGGKVQTANLREYGYAELQLDNQSSLFTGIEDRKNSGGQAVIDVWMSHSDQVTALPKDFSVICTTQNAPIAGMANEAKQWYGLQFHPEVTHTPQGINILQRFVITICKAKTNWTAANIISQTVSSIKEQAGSEKVLLGLSGGVDSSVAAVLLHQAIGSQLYCVFVDTGLLRHNEAEQVLDMFDRHLGINIIHVKAEEQFLRALQGIDCPEQKRKIIGHIFIEIFEQQAKKLPEVKWLAQGTIYPDVIESAAANSGAAVIKSHHNVAGLPKKLNLKLIEPLRKLFKDEVRKIGLALGMPDEMVFRHPFPGPGLGVRILGEVKKEYADILRQADYIFLEELSKAGLYQQVSQAFAVFLPIKSVGVAGDERVYDYVICLRAVKTNDFMTAEWAHLPWDFLGKVSNRIINEVKGVSRVTYDISGKPPATIEWE